MIFLILVIILIFSTIIAYTANLFEYHNVLEYSTNIAVSSFALTMLYIITDVFYRILTV